MSEQKWKELNDKIEHLTDAYYKIRRERDELRKELEEFKKQTLKLTRGNKNDILLKERIKVLEEERRLIREKTKTLLKILKEYKE